MAVTFELRLKERLSDRVVVSAHLAPAAEPVHVEGIAVELYSRTEESLGPLVLLPVSGPLNAAVCVRVELRCDEAHLPLGATIVGTAWWDGGHATVRCPADPGTSKGRGADGQPW